MYTTPTDHPGSQATLQDGLDEGEILINLERREGMVGGQKALHQRRQNNMHSSLCCKTKNKVTCSPVS